MEKIGFFGGSFNPPTNAHINLAIDVINKYNLDKIVFVPIGDFYEKQELIDFNHRYTMLKLACKKNEQLEVSNIEDDRTTKLYAIDIFRIIKNKYLSDEVYYIMGSDNLAKLQDWKSYDELIKNYRYIILERNKGEFKKVLETNEFIKEYENNFKVLTNSKYIDMSSTLIRDKIKNGENVSNLIPIEVLKYIEDKHLYIGM